MALMSLYLKPNQIFTATNLWLQQTLVNSYNSNCATNVCVHLMHAIARSCSEFGELSWTWHTIFAAECSYLRYSLDMYSYLSLIILCVKAHSIIHIFNTAMVTCSDVGNY